MHANYAGLNEPLLNRKVCSHDAANLLQPATDSCVSSRDKKFSTSALMSERAFNCDINYSLK